MALSTASFSLLFAGCERSMIYYPTRSSEESLRGLAQSRGLTPWHNESGERIGWRSASPGAGGSGTALAVFHGNAGHAADRSYFVDGIGAAVREEPWTIFLFEYPGYGSRPGQPSERVIKAGARAAVQHLLAEGFTSLFVAGESLGGGVASHLAATFPDQVDGVVLITPFTSLAEVAQHHYPGWLVRMLLSERYDNVDELTRYRGPVAILLAGEDEVVPAELGRRLHDTYQGPKRLWVQSGRGHNTLDLSRDASWWRELVQFLRSTPNKKPRSPS